MKNVAILAIAGLAAAASAQGVTLHFDADGDALTGSDVISASGDASWTVYASFTGFGSTAYFGGFVGSFDGSGTGTASNPTGLMAGEGTAPAASGANITNINMFNSALLGTDDQSNPIAVFTFDTSGTSDELSYGATGVASMFADDGIFTLPTEFTGGDINIITDRIVVPAPGAAALLGLGGLAAARRRR